MFGDLMGNMEAKKAEMQEKLASIEISESIGDGAVTVKANANREFLNISIDKSKLSSDDMEELEDLLLTVLNRTLAKAGAKEAEESQKMVNDLMPPGLGNLFGGM